MKGLVIFGTGDVARLAYYYFTKDSSEKVVAFTVDRDFMTQETFFGLPVVPSDQVLERYPPTSHKMFVALSYAKMNQVRADRYLQAKAQGYEFASYVSSHCTYLAENPPGENCLIMEDNTIQPYVKIGNNNILWSGNHIGHDTVIGDHCFITSHVVVSGYCQVGDYCFMGVNATLRNSIKIADKTLIGAGAIVMKSTQPGDVYLPERAKLFSKKSHEIEI